MAFQLAETMSHMQPLFQFSQQHPDLPPADALSELVASFHAQSQFGASPMTMQQSGSFQMHGQLPPGVGTPNSMNAQNMVAAGSIVGHQLHVGASPSAAHLALPGSPHIVNHPSPSQQNGNGGNSNSSGTMSAGTMQAPGLVAQHSQQGTNSSQGTSANTSPNAAQNKRRRPSAIKVDGEDGAGGGGGPVTGGLEMNGVGAGPSGPGVGAVGAAGQGGSTTAGGVANSKVKPSPRLGGGGGNKKQKTAHS